MNHGYYFECLLILTGITLYNQHLEKTELVDIGIDNYNELVVARSLTAKALSHNLLAALIKHQIQPLNLQQLKIVTSNKEGVHLCSDEKSQLSHLFFPPSSHPNHHPSMTHNEAQEHGLLSESLRTYHPA